MADENNEHGTGTGTATTDPPPAPPERRSVPATERPVPDDPAEARAELERTRKALQDRNAENARQRQRLEELERAEEERKAGQLSELDKARREQQQAAQKAADAERRAHDAHDALVRTKIDHAVEREAQKMGFEYPDLAPQIVDRNRIKYEPELNRVEGVKEALERVVKDRPGLIKASPRGGTPSFGGARGGGATGGDRDQPRALTPEEDLLRQGGYV